MIRKPWVKLILAASFLGLMGLGLFLVDEGDADISINGVVCNHSSTGVWLSVSEGERQTTYSLAPDRCTDFFRQDAEAIWGNDCSTEPCHYQAWKVGAGHYDVEDNGNSASSSVLRIHGWGMGSSWHITHEWPKPELSAIRYSLVK